MPGAVIDIHGRSNRCVAPAGADANHKLSVHDGRAPVRAAAAHFAVHQTFAVPPLRAGAARRVGGLYPHGDGEVVRDGARDGNVAARSVELRGLASDFAGHVTDRCGRAVIAAAAAVLRVAFKGVEGLKIRWQGIGSRNHQQRDALGRRGERDAAGAHRCIRKMIDRVRAGQLPDLSRVAGHEVAEVHRDGRVVGEIFANHHYRQRAVGAALGGEGGHVVRVGYSRRYTGVAERALVAVIVAIHLERFVNRSGAVQAAPERRDIHAFTTEDAEHIGFRDSPADMAFGTPTVFGDGELGAGIIGVDPGFHARDQLH